MNFNFRTLQIEQHSQQILIVTLNRPAVRNAINSEMMIDLDQLWKEMQTGYSNLRCVILTGAEIAFCAGADLKERKNLSMEIWKTQHKILVQAMKGMLQCPLPIIAAVNGAAFGGGLEMVLASDFAYASKTATFAQSEVKIGIIPGAFGTQNLPRACGLKRAKELVFTGAAFSAADALDWGIVNKICEPEELMEEVLVTANRICDNAPIAIREAKKALNLSQQIDIQSGFESELEFYYRALATKDREEGIRAFNDKRKPVYVGE